MQVGDNAALSRTVSQADIKAFADASGDHNPVHFDVEFAKSTRFGRPIAHGMIAASLISAALGTVLPGPGSVYIGQSLNFKRPVYPGDTITAHVEVAALDPERHRVTMRTVVKNQDGKVVLDGEAQLLVESAAG